MLLYFHAYILHCLPYYFLQYWHQHYEIYKANIIIAIFQIRKLRRLRGESRPEVIAQVMEQDPKWNLRVEV